MSELVSTRLRPLPSPPAWRRSFWVIPAPHEPGRDALRRVRAAEHRGPTGFKIPMYVRKQVGAPHKPARGQARGFLRGLILFCGLAMGLPSAWAGEGDLSKLPPPSTQRNVTYEKDIFPILEKTCFGCHGPKMQKGKLRLDSLEAVLTGGKDGKVLEKGSSAKSMIVKLVARLDPDNAMPPKGAPLDKEQVGLIRAWIDQGAK